MSSTIRFRAIATILAIGFAASAQAADVTGAGASFVYPVMSKWSADYNKATGKQVNYQSIGSGGGIAQIKAGTVDFGSSDAPLKPDELAKFGLAQFPSVIGGVVPVINVPGVASGALKLDGPTARQHLPRQDHDVERPGDRRAQRRRCTLPAKKITIVHRSDGSGTTFNFVNYLSKVSPEWKTKVGEGTSVKWPTGIGGKGNEGVAAYVKQISGGIGYVELSYALQNKMAYARHEERRRQLRPAVRRELLRRRRQRRLDEREGLLPGHDQRAGREVLADHRHQLHPHVQAAEECRRAPRPRRTSSRWAYANGDAQAKALDYVPLPDALVKQIEAYWSQSMKY